MDKKSQFVLYPSIFAVFTFLFFSLLSRLTGYHIADRYVVVLEILYVILGCFFVFFIVKSNNIESDDYATAQLNSDALFAKILDNLPVGVLILDEKGSIADVNKAAAKIYGYSKNQLLNKTIVQLCPEWEENRVAYILNRVLTNRYKSVSENWQQVTAGRKIIDLKVWIEPLLAGNKTIVTLAMVDISAQKQIENELLLSLEELDSFTYRAAQDLRAPLTQIMGLCKLVKTEKKIGDLNALAYFELVANAAARMEYSIYKLLIFNSLKNKVPDIHPVNVLEIVSRAIEEVQLDKRIDITVLIEVSPQLNISSDASLINIILRSLLENAITYRDSSYRNSYIRIAAVQKNGNLIIRVNDNGIGIPKESIPHLFKNSYKGVNLMQGTGMGLYVAQVAANKLGGAIELVCSRPGQTEFMVTLPLEWFLAAQNPAHSESTHSSKK
jgi:PAS domain S-box-containing protein